MALDKSRTPAWVKIGIIVLISAFVISFIPLASGGFFGGSNEQRTAGQLEQIAQQHTGAIASFEQALASEPESVTLLVALGNTYFDWAARAQEVQTAPGADRPMWFAAAQYYESALDIDPSDPNVATDLAIAYYNSGRTQRAIDTVSAVTKANPEFAPAYFNAGIFYRDAGMEESAAASLRKSLELEPQAQFAESARQFLAELGQTAPPGSAPGSPDTTQ